MKLGSVLAVVLLAAVACAPAARGPVDPATRLVEEHVEEFDRGTARIRVKVDAQLANGLALVTATPDVHGHPGYRCVLFAEAARCDAEGAPLEWAVQASGLHAAPRALPLGDWVRLVAFLERALSVYRSEWDVPPGTPPAALGALRAPAMLEHAEGTEVRLVITREDGGVAVIDAVSVVVRADGRVTHRVTRVSGTAAEK